MLCSPSRFAGLTTLWVSLWPGFFTPVRCICISIGIFTETRCSAVRMASAWDLSQLPTWQELFRRKLPTINTMHLPSSLLLIVSIVMTICMAHISDILQYKLDGCHIAVNKQQKPGWPFWLQAGSTWPLVYGLTPPDYWELVVGTFYDSKCQKHETWRWRFVCRLFFAWCLFVWQLLSPRWTVTPSTFTLSTGSTETQSTGAAISSSTHPLWLIYFEFFRPYGFGSWGVGSAGFGKKMTVASRPNSLYGGYSFWSILNLNLLKF